MPLMTLGKVILSAAFAAAIWTTALPAGEAVVSRKSNAAVSIGGEVRTDYSFRTSSDKSSSPSRDGKYSDFAVRGASLRINADVHPNIKAILKIDLSASVEIHGDLEEMLEEALIVMSAVGGTGFGFFAGKGRAPYGQDVTLGMIQSYHHEADRADSSEGRIFLTDPPDELPPMRPGQFDRVLAAGATYGWEDRWKVELAAFQPSRFRYEPRLRDGGDRENPAGIGAAARIWWMPFEDFVVQASAMVVRSGRMADTGLRKDVLSGAPGADGTEAATAFSAGFDYRRGDWRIFGEYQHGRDWNFTEGYNTDTWQLGAAYTFAPGWRIGAMAESLRIADAARDTRTAYYKGALNLRHTFENGLFILAEYGHERRRRRGAVADDSYAHFAGMRLGFAF